MPFDPNMLPGGFGYGQSDPSQLGWLWNAQANGQLPSSFLNAEYDPAAAAGAQDARESAALRLMRGVKRGSPMAPTDIWSQGTPPVFGSLAPEMGGGETAQPAAMPMPSPAAPQPAAPSPSPMQSLPQMFAPGALGMAPNLTQPSPDLGALPAPMEGQVAPRTPTIPLADTRPLTSPALRASMSGTAPTGSLLDRIGNGINNNADLLLAMGAGFAGAGSFGEGMHRAFSNAAPLAGKNQTIDALMSRGMPQDLARAAAANPAILQQLLPSMFGPKQMKFTQIGEDMMGNKRYGFVNEVNGEVLGMDGKAITSSGAGSNAIPSGPDGQPLQGQALLTHLENTEPMVASALKDMYEGKLNPNARNLQKLGPLASLVYPGFDATQYPVRLNVRKSYTSGKDFQETQALNTVSGHMVHLMDAADGLDNSSFKPINSARNWWSDHISDNPALVKFRNALVTTSNELAKAYHGGHVTDAAYGAFNKAINEAQTPEALKAAIGEIGGLLKSKIEAKESGYRSSMDQAPMPSEYRAINDEAKNAFNRINDWAYGKQSKAVAPVAGAAPAAPVAPVAPPAPGKYVYDPATGTMKPVQ